MTGTQDTWRKSLYVYLVGGCAFLALGTCASTVHAAVKIFDGFGDADRNNDGAINSLDTDLNDSGTFNDPTADALLIARGITEVTAATNPGDVGITWTGIRSYDTTANLVKSKLRIINDSVAIGSETVNDIHGDGLALGVESRGGGSSFIGKFGQSINLGAAAGDKVVVSFDWRVWREANDNTSTPGFNNELRWGIFEDTDHELGQTGAAGLGGANIVWGKDDGNWFAAQPGAEGDKGIHTGLPFGTTAVGTDARIRWEYNQAGINGTTNNGRILEGSGVSDTAGVGGDTATIATPPGNGPGGIITDLSNYTPHNLKLELVRLADGSVEVASFVDATELLRDSIKATDTGYNVLQPVPVNYDYVAIRNATGDWDYVIDNFKVEVFGSNAGGVLGDFNSNGVVDSADYVLWRNGGPLVNEVSDIGTVSAADYNDWRARFGNTSGSGMALDGRAAPEPATYLLVLLGQAAGTLLFGRRDRGR